MKRIKDYINKHPKLKRVAKILGVVAIILSFLFNALIIGSLIINANKPNDSKVLAYGDYQPKMAYNTESGGHVEVYLSFGDFGNTTIIKSLVYKTCEYANRLSSFENGLSDLSSNANGPIRVSSNLSNGEIYFIDDNNTSNKLIQAYFEVSDSPYANFKMLTFWCTKTTNSPGYFRLEAYFNPADYTGIYGYNVPAYTMSSIALVTYGNTGITLPSCQILADMTNSNNNISNIIFGWDYFSTQNDNNIYNQGYNQGYSHGEIAGKAEGIEEGYASGYDAGLHENDAYGLGYTDGYNTGETAGYNQGYSEGSTGMSSNPFKLIANAFDAVASILNIQVLPNLTLGVLVFTPVIVIIILVVVKFIRG